MSISNLNRIYLNTPATYTLMLVILVISLITFFNKHLFAALLLHPYTVIRKRQYYRLITSDLVHNDLIHLVVNEWLLYVFGSDLEETLIKTHQNGSWLFWIVYLISMLTGAVIVTARHYGDFTYSTAGASGSTMGCMFSFILLNPKGSSLHLPVIGNIQNIYCGLLYIIFLILYRRKSGNEMIDMELHFFGALGGIAATFLLSKLL